VVDVEHGRFSHLQRPAALNRGELGVIASSRHVLDTGLATHRHGALAVHGDAGWGDRSIFGVLVLEPQPDAAIDIDRVVVSGDLQAGPLTRLPSATSILAADWTVARSPEMSRPRAPSRTVSVPERLAFASSPVIETSDEPAPVAVASMSDAWMSASSPVMRTAVPPSEIVASPPSVHGG
jgi:hypothetical protein